jgi:signal transduction histidine kinase
MQHRILIVDDNPVNVSLLEDILSDEYQHIATAGSGEEALEVAETFHPTLILLDIMMPGIDGYETCRRIRETQELRTTKVIMLSAKALLAERLHGYEVGADDYITKPFDEDELLAKVRVYLRLKSLEEVDLLKSDLLGLLSHETRTPLNGIIPPLELLVAGEVDDPEEQQMLLEMALHSAKRLLTLFDRVMTLSSMKAGTWDFRRTPVAFEEIVREAVAMVTADSASPAVRVHVEVVNEVTTYMDAQQMRETIGSLVENAVRFSPPEGCVEVKVWRDEAWICVTVTDQGPGIEPRILPHLFDGFAEADMLHHATGQGLSLAIAQQVVRAHGGTIDVMSTEGCTAFTVRLPIIISAEAGEQECVGVSPNEVEYHLD